MSSHVIDVAIGLAYVYLIFSLICTVVNEFFAQLFSLRALNLAKGIKSLFSEDGAADAHFATKIYSHGLVRGLYRGPAGGSTNLFSRLFLNKLPSYIPAATFATALIDSIAPGAGSGQNAFNQVQTAIQKLPGSTTKDALLSLTLSAEGKLENFQKNVEGWFNDSMDRASGWYKRTTKRILLVIAFVVTIAANADSARIVRTLWNNPEALKNSIDAANQYIENNKNAKKSDEVKSVDDVRQKVTTLANELPAGVPIGWAVQKNQKSIKDAIGDALKNPDNFGGWSTALGWIFTALALSLGAPFWFDVLNKFMVVRSTVKPKEKAGKATKG